MVTGGRLEIIENRPFQVRRPTAHTCHYFGRSRLAIRVELMRCCLGSTYRESEARGARRCRIYPGTSNEAMPPVTFVRLDATGGRIRLHDEAGPMASFR